jgi:hypothetical protein
MSIKADSLKINENKKKIINKQVVEILAHIDEELKKAHEQDKNVVSVTVPITFSIPYVSNKNAQRIIYSRLLESLIDRGYDVKISLSEEQTKLIIRWLTDEEEKDIEKQNQLLAKHTIRE